jgi:hypothetical protein
MTPPAKAPRPEPGDNAPAERISIMPEQDGPLAAALRVRDKTVVEYDARWGTDVLQTLVSPATAALFASVRERLDEAIKAANKAIDDANKATDAAKKAISLQAHAAALDIAINTMAVEMRGLAKMEKDALAAGRKPLDPGRAWAFKLADGMQAVLVQTDEDARAARRSQRFTGWVIYSVSEMAHILSERSLTGIIDAKKAFPDATVIAVKTPPDWKQGDEVSF